MKTLMSLVIAEEVEVRICLSECFLCVFFTGAVVELSTALWWCCKCVCIVLVLDALYGITFSPRRVFKRASSRTVRPDFAHDSALIRRLRYVRWTTDSSMRELGGGPCIVVHVFSGCFRLFWRRNAS